MPLSAPKVDGQKVENATWSQKRANGGWLPLRLKRTDRHAPQQPPPMVEVLRAGDTPVQLMGVGGETPVDVRELVNRAKADVAPSAHALGAQAEASAHLQTTTWKAPATLAEVSAALKSISSATPQQMAEIVDAAEALLSQPGSSAGASNANAHALLCGLAAAQRDMPPPLSARVNGICRPRLASTLGSMGADTPKAERDAVAEMALAYLADPGVSFQDKTADGADVAAALAANRCVLLEQLRQPDVNGLAPPILRKHAVPLLEAYRTELQRLKAANEQPRTPAWDTLVLPLLIETRNAAKPNLKLQLFNAEQLTRHIQQHAQAAKDDIAVLDMGDFGVYNTVHHGVAYVSNDPAREPRLAILDSVSDPTYAAKEVVKGLPSGARAVPVKLETQKAEDCVIFSLSNASKIASRRDAVNALFDEPSTQSVVSPAVIGADKLPPSFFKHSQSSKPLHRLQTVLGTEESAAVLSRFDAHRVTRTQENLFGEEEVVSYGASIEQKRLQFVEQGITHFAGGAQT